MGKRKKRSKTENGREIKFRLPFSPRPIPPFFSPSKLAAAACAQGQTYEEDGGSGEEAQRAASDAINKTSDFPDRKKKERKKRRERAGGKNKGRKWGTVGRRFVTGALPRISSSSQKGGIFLCESLSPRVYNNVGRGRGGWLGKVMNLSFLSSTPPGNWEDSACFVRLRFTPADRESLFVGIELEHSER